MIHSDNFINHEANHFSTLSENVRKDYGGVNYVLESYNSMINNWLRPYIENLVERHWPELCPREYKKEGFVIILKVTPSTSTMISGRYASQFKDQYNNELTIEIRTSKSDFPAHRLKLYLPNVVRSAYCRSNKMTNRECIEMGLAPADIGGYIINSKGNNITIRSKETVNPNILISRANTSKKKKASSKSEISEMVKRVEEDKISYRKNVGTMSTHSDKIPEKIEHMANILGFKDHYFNVTAQPIKQPKKIVTHRNSGKKRVMSKLKYSSNQLEMEPSESSTGGTLVFRDSAKSRLLDAFEILPHPCKTGDSYDSDNYKTSISYTDYYGLSTYVYVSTIEGEFYIEFSLPKNTENSTRNTDSDTKTYLPMALGISSFRSKVLFVLHLLFHTLKHGITAETDYLTLFNEDYSSEILECVLESTSYQIGLEAKSLLSLSIEIYKRKIKKINLFELLVSLYSDMPTVVKINNMKDLYTHLLEFIIPIQHIPGVKGVPEADSKIALYSKIKSIGRIVLGQIKVMSTKTVSDLDTYANKSEVTLGNNMFRFIREQINSMFKNLRARQQKLMLEPNALLPSFAVKSDTSQTKSKFDSDRQTELTTSKVLLTNETFLKNYLMCSSLMIHGSKYIAQVARQVQDSQIGSVCPLMTNESGEAGLKREPAIHAHISSYRHPSIVNNYLTEKIKDPGFRDLSHKLSSGFKLITVESIPCGYVTEEFYKEMRYQFSCNAPVRHLDTKNIDSENYGLATFDIVFYERDSVYNIIYSGGIVGHMALRVKDDNLLVKDWSKSPSEMINDGELFFVSTMEPYFECPSPELFYSTPSINDLPLDDEGKPARYDTDKMKNCKTLCKWCWHSTKKITRLDLYGQIRNDSMAGGIDTCSKCDQQYHKDCIGEFEYNTTTSFYDSDDDTCPACRNSPCIKETVRNFREDYYSVQIRDHSLFGTLACTSVFGAHNYGVRVAYHSNMVLQAIDSNPVIDKVHDPTMKSSESSDIPMCATEVDYAIQKDAHNGTNLFVATIMLPNNNEDALYVSERAAATLLRYSYRYTKRYSLQSSLKNTILVGGVEHNIRSEYLGISPKVNRARFGNIDPATGIPKLGAFIMPGEAILAKYTVTTTGEHIDTSEYATIDSYGIVEHINIKKMQFNKTGSVVLGNTKMSVSVIFKISRCYIQGDKLCARYSQKGVVAQVLPADKMGEIVGGVFDGAVPDLINSVAILPTRMTMGLVIEMYASTVAALTMEQVDATPFRFKKGTYHEQFRVFDTTKKYYDDILKEHGVENGIVHQYRMPGTDNMAPVMGGFLRMSMLRHHSADKIKCSFFDPSIIGTGIFRQKSKGRSSGLRIGLQEGLGYYSAGASSTLHELVASGSTKETVLACPECGHISTINITDYTCNICKTGKLLATETVYSIIALTHILAQQGIDLKLFPVPAK
jgi:DNA-directed RNA polymerase beta subunit